MEKDRPMLPCQGRLVRVHLIPQQVIKRSGGNPADRRSWVWACGGITGVGGHHGLLDTSRRLRVLRRNLPGALLAFAMDNGLMWYIERNYK